MKLKKTLPLLILSALLFLGLSSLSANASSWKKGVPDSINSPMDQPWISNKKFDAGTNNKGIKIYNKTILFTNNQIGGAYRSYYMNGEPDKSYLPGWFQNFADPYYKEIGKCTYIIKNKVAAKYGLQRVKIQKVSNDKIKVWNKLKVGKYSNSGIYTKINLDIYVNVNPM